MGNMVNVENASKSKKVNILTAFVLTFAFAVLFVVFNNFRFAINDDRFISFILSGFYGEASPYTVYLNIIPSLILKCLYSLCPNISWYVLYLLSLVVFSFFLITYLLLDKLDSICAFALSLLLLLSTGAIFFKTPTYTTVAALACSAGYAGALSGLYDRKIRRIMLSGLLIVSGATMRFMSFLLASPLPFICILAYFADKIAPAATAKERCLTAAAVIREEKHYFISILSILLLIFCTYCINAAAYNLAPQWKYFSEYNAVRTQILDFNGVPSYDTHIEQYNDMGWSENDADMLAHWSFEDSSVFSLESMQRIEAMHERKLLSVKKILRTMVQACFECKPFVLGCLLAVCSLLKHRSKHKLLLFCAYAFTALAMLLYLVLIGRIVDRASNGVGMSFLIIIIFSFYIRGSSRSKFDKLAVILLAVSAVMFVMLIYKTCTFELPAKREEKAQRFSYNSVVSGLSEKLPKNNLYLCDAFSYVNLWSTFSATETPPVGMGDNIYVLGTWLSPSPLLKNILSSYNVSEPYSALCSDPNVFLISQGYDAIVRHTTHLREHYEASIDWSVYDALPFYSIVAVQTPPDISKAKQSIDVGLSVSECKVSSDDKRLISLSGCVDEQSKLTEGSIYVLRIVQNDEAAHYYRIKLHNDGTFSLSIPIEELSGNHFCAQLICSENTADNVIWISESVELALTASSD